LENVMARVCQNARCNEPLDTDNPTEYCSPECRLEDIADDEDDIPLDDEDDGPDYGDDE
jgi:hypothetical protein